MTHRALNGLPGALAMDVLRLLEERRRLLIKDAERPVD